MMLGARGDQSAGAELLKGRAAREKEGTGCYLRRVPSPSLPLVPVQVGRGWPQGATVLQGELPACNTAASSKRIPLGDHLAAADVRRVQVLHTPQLLRLRARHRA